MCEASRRVANSGRSQRLRCNTLPLFTLLPRRYLLGNSGIKEEPKLLLCFGPSLVCILFLYFYRPEQ